MKENNIEKLQERLETLHVTQDARLACNADDLDIREEIAEVEEEIKELQDDTNADRENNIKNERSSIEEDIERLKLCSTNQCNICGRYEKEECMLERNRCEQHILSDYKRVLKENEHKTEKIENQKAELAILNEKQKDFNKLQNTLSSYKGQFRRQEKENEKINSLIKKLEKDSEEQQWIQTADDEYLAHTEKAMYADDLLSFLRGEE